MKWILAFLLMFSVSYADYSSIERPNLNLGREESKELLGNIEHRLGDLVNEFAVMKALILEQQRCNLILTTINENLLDFMRITEKSNELLEHLIWIQDHRVSEVSPKKSG